MTETTNDIERTIRVVPFDGDPTAWVEWRENFYAKAVEAGYDEILDGDVTAPADNTPNPSPEERLLIRLNKRAYSQMIIGLSDTPFGIVKDAKTEAHPKGDARQTWMALMTKYESQEADMGIDLEVMLHDCKPNSGDEDLEKWFQRLHHLRRRLDNMGHAKQDSTIIAVILAHLPDEYATIRSTARTTARKGALTLDDLEADIRDHY